MVSDLTWIYSIPRPGLRHNRQPGRPRGKGGIWSLRAARAGERTLDTSGGQRYDSEEVLLAQLSWRAQRKVRKGRDQMGERRLRVGIIGVGRIAVEAHIPCFRRAGAEVIALADVVEGRAARFAQQFDIPYAFDDVHGLLAMPEVDAVSVCTPPVAHEEVATAALEAGKHVYMEKPPALNEAQMARVVETRRRADRRLLVGSHTIYHPEIQTLKRYIDAGELGDIYVAKHLGSRRRGLPHGWYRRRAVVGGGATIEDGSHKLDRVLYLLDTPKPVSVIARTFHKFGDTPSAADYMDMDFAEGRTRDVPVMETEDLAEAFVQFDTGCVLLFESGYMANTPDGAPLWVYGTRAGASWPPLTIYGEAPDGTVTDTRPAFPDGPRDHVPAFRHFLTCIHEGRETESSGERTVVLMRIVDAIYRSVAQGGREVRLDE
jgi:predicted dehydrogenase